MVLGRYLVRIAAKTRERDCSLGNRTVQGGIISSKQLFMSTKLFWIIGLFLLVLQLIFLPVARYALPVNLVLVWVIWSVCGSRRSLVSRGRAHKILANIWPVLLLLALADLGSGGQWGILPVVGYLTFVIIRLSDHWLWTINQPSGGSWLRPVIATLIFYNFADWLWLNLNWAFERWLIDSPAFLSDWSSLQLYGWLNNLLSKQLYLLVVLVLFTLLLGYVQFFQKEKLSYR